MDIFLNVLRCVGIITLFLVFPVLWIHALCNWDGQIEYDEDNCL